MAGSEENVQRADLRGSLLAGGGKPIAAAGHNRRALSDINMNIVGPPPYPCAVNKRALSEKCSAEPAEKQQFKSELPFHETKGSVLTSTQSADVHIIDAVEEDCTDESSDFVVPVFVQHTEAMLEEIDRMEEIEMEDMDEELVVDIDSSNKNNPLEVVEYVDDIYRFYWKTESSSCVLSNYMENQHDINERMRGILIDWLIEVHYKFELMEETLYLTVNLIDRFLAVQQVVRKKLQLVGITAMLLACKYEEVSVPVVEDLVLVSDKAYSGKEVLDMEKLILKSLQYNLSVPTPYVFMRRFLKAAQSDKKLELLSFFIIELCLVKYQMLRYPPSLLAASAIYTAQCTVSQVNQWSKTCELHTGYSEDQLLECSRQMVGLHQKAGTGELKGVNRKYSTSKFGYAATAEPANFLLQTGF